MTAPYSEEAPVEASPPPPFTLKEEKTRALASAVFLAFGSAFWTIASLLSLTVNIILIVVLIYFGSQLSNITGGLTIVIAPTDITLV